MNLIDAKCDDLAYQSAGQGDEVVIALHGWLDNSNSFLPLMRQLPELEWYAFDFPGHGKSKWRSHDAHYYFVDYVNDVHRFVSSLGVSKIHFVGHSMGAMVAQLFCACFPDKVKSLTLIEGFAGLSTPANEVPTQLKNAILQRTRNKRKQIKFFNSEEEIIDKRLAVSDFSRDIAYLLMSRNIQVIDDKFRLTTDPKLTHHSGLRFVEQQVIEICKQTTAPTLLITARSGYAMVKDNYNQFKGYVPNMAYVEVEGGHHCHLESSRDVAQLITRQVMQFS